MRQLNKKDIVMIVVGVFALLLAYSFDQYYIYRRQLFFLSKPIEFINQLFNHIGSQ